jgi:hypothetical protein
MMIEAWGESGDDLRYLPVYEETYKVYYRSYTSLYFVCTGLLYQAN